MTNHPTFCPTDQKLLLVGPRFNRNKNQVGGIVVLFENLVDYCQTHGIDYSIIDTNKSNYRGGIFVTYINIIYQLYTEIHNADIVMINGTFKDYLYIGPFVRRWCKKQSKPYVLRKFAGNFHLLYDKASNAVKYQLKNVIKDAAMCYWETKELVQWGQKININSKWFPNVRKRPNIQMVAPEKRLKHLVFMSHVKKAKGIDETLIAYNHFSDKYDLDIYGNLIDYTQDDLQGKYRGVVEPENVPKVLSNLLLLLLTSWGEGYPGIIIEAFSIGLPVLASKAGGIPEMVTDGYNGILVDVKNPQSIIDGLKRFGQLDYNQLCRNALKSFDDYDSDKVTSRVMEDMLQLTKL